MAYKIRYIYDNSVNLDNVYDKLIEDCATAMPSEGLIRCKKIKEQGYPEPVGFSLIDYDEYDLNEPPIVKNYYFNAKIITPENAPQNWSRDVFKLSKKFLLVNENFCIHYDEETDKIIKTNL